MTTYKKRCVYLTEKYSSLLAEDVRKEGVKESEVLRQIIKKHYDERANKEAKP